LSILALILLIGALVIFAIRALVVFATTPRVNLIALGLALFCAYVLALHFTNPVVGH
jgi:hypothetical protein